MEKRAESFENKVIENIKENKREEDDIVGDWKTLKQAVLESAKSEIGYKEGVTAKKLWVTEEMIRKMDERRKWKNVTTEEGIQKYKALNNELRRETDKVREEWWKEKCVDLEELDRRDRSDLLYKKVRQLTGQSRQRNNTSTIKDKNGNLLTDKDDIKNRWKEYIEVLYDGEGKPLKENLKMEKESEVDLLASEIKAAIKE